MLSGLVWSQPQIETILQWTPTILLVTIPSSRSQRSLMLPNDNFQTCLPIGWQHSPIQTSLLNRCYMMTNISHSSRLAGSTAASQSEAMWGNNHFTTKFVDIDFTTKFVRLTAPCPWFLYTRSNIHGDITTADWSAVWTGPLLWLPHLANDPANPRPPNKGNCRNHYSIQKLKYHMRIARMEGWMQMTRIYWNSYMFSFSTIVF